MKYTGEIAFGRKRRAEIPARRKINRVAESFAFTLGLVFVIVYFAGLFVTCGDFSDDGSSQDALPVFAEVAADSERSERRGGLWDALDDCLREVFGGRETGE